MVEKEVANGKNVTIITNNMQCASNKQFFATMERYFDLNGWTVREDFDTDLVVFATCGFHNEMFDIVVATLGKLKAIGFPAGKIVMTGCVPKTHEPEIKRIFDGKIINFGEESVLDGIIQATVPFAAIQTVNIFKYPFQSQEEEKEQMFNIQIGEGCLRECTFCVINKAHGNIRSRPAEEIAEEFGRAVGLGYKKIFMNATDSFAYGYERGDNIIALIERLLRIESDVKFYFSNLHVRWLREYQDGILSLCKRGVINLLHISLQHVNLEILKMMGRPYNFTETYAIIRRIKSECPYLFMMADLIVGFPGETDEIFTELRDFVKEDKCFNMFMHNQYSDHEGAPSSRFKNKVPPEIKRLRFHMLKAAMRERYPSIALSRINESESHYFKYMFEREYEKEGYFFCKDTYIVS